EGLVEADTGRRVDDDVARRPRGPVVVGQAEAVGGDVARHPTQAAPDEVVEAVAGFGPQSVQRVVAEDLALDPPGRGRPPSGPHPLGRVLRRAAEPTGFTRAVGVSGPAGLVVSAVVDVDVMVDGAAVASVVGAGATGGAGGGPNTGLPTSLPVDTLCTPVPSVP